MHYVMRVTTPLFLEIRDYDLYEFQFGLPESSGSPKLRYLQNYHRAMMA